MLMRSKSQYSLYNIRYQSQMHRNEINVLRSRSASFERTMPCPLTIPKTNKKTFHVISRKKIQIHLGDTGAHAKPIPGWKVRQMSLEHTHTKSRSDWLNFCNNSIRIYILSWGGRFQPTLLFHIWEALWHFVTTPMSQKLRLSSWPNVPKVQH